jgi:uncharacterized membrane protein HdeD (DUF308 family)
MKSETLAEVQQNSGWLIAMGVLMVVLGIAALVDPFVATIALSSYYSWMFLFAGVIQTIYAIQNRSQSGFWLRLVIGILYISAGVLLVSNLLGTALTLTFFFGWVILTQGVIEAIAALVVRPEPNWGWMLFNGIIGIVLGVLILKQWPLGAAWLLGTYVGFNLLSTGITMIAVPLAIRRSYKQLAT